MRIIAGKYKYRRLSLQKKLNFNPILSSVRESLFNTLNFRINWANTTVADVFAGSGILGVESLSRGARFCYFNDLNHLNSKRLKMNLENFAAPNARVDNLNHLQFLTQLFQLRIKLDLVFLTPPYSHSEYAQQAIASLLKHHLLNPKAVIVVQLDSAFTYSDSKLKLFQTKKYGRTQLFYYQFQNSAGDRTLLDFKNHQLIIFSGPSGVGKKSILHKLLRLKDLNLGYSVSCTTRKKRLNEINHHDYHFLTISEFQDDIKNGYFLEYAKYLDNYYGTSFYHTQTIFNQGKNPLLEIEIQGAAQVKSLYPQAIWIFVFPPNLEEIKNRLEKRNSETASEIIKRIKMTKKELKVVTSQNLCDFYIENQNLSVTVEKIADFLRREFKNRRALK